MSRERGRGPANRPRLVLIGGAPGSGKTTLARRLAPALGLPLLSRDEIKEALYDTLGSPDVASSRRLGPPSYEVLYAVLRRLLEAGVGAVVESNFHRGISEPVLRPLVAQSRACLVQCQAPPDLLARRTVERAQRGERHPGHHDADVVKQVLANLGAGTFEPLELDIPVLRLDTSDGLQPDWAAILAFVQAE